VLRRGRTAQRYCACAECAGAAALQLTQPQLAAVMRRMRELIRAAERFQTRAMQQAFHAARIYRGGPPSEALWRGAVRRMRRDTARR